MNEFDWDERFANANFIKGGDSYPTNWAQKARDFREQWGAKARLDLPYGSHSREIYDHFRVQNPKGAMVFVHGGYWLKFDKSYWSHLAKGALERGYEVYIPSYPLAPDKHVFEITNSIARFIENLDERQPLYLVGHSAGGHLVSRMLEIGRLSEMRAAQIENVVAISGVFDLRNLIKTKMNTDLRLSDDEVQAESPLFQDSQPISITAWVGANERPEFVSQAQSLASVWQKNGHMVNLVMESGRHHFNVIEGLEDPNSPMMDALFDIDRSAKNLGARFENILQNQKLAPKNYSPIEMLCVRQKMGERTFPEGINLDPEDGVIGDRWKTNNWVKKADGSSDERNQISILPARIYRALCASVPDAMHPGDPIISDIDCSFANLPIGQKLGIGDAVVEVSDVPNYGCEKWRDRYGVEAWKFIAHKGLRKERLRGVLCRIVKGGHVQIGDSIEKI